MSRTRTLAVLSVLTVLAPVGATIAPAQAAPAKSTLACAVTADNPHYSKGAKGWIFKARSTCAGDLPGSLTVKGYLVIHKAGAYGPYPSAATNSATYSVVGGSQHTLYVPAASANGKPCPKGYVAYGSATSTLRAGGQSVTKNATSATVTC